jgi:5-aminopentanamidase
MKVLINQSTPVFGDVAANLATIEHHCRSAQTLKLDVAVFPELFLTGYHIGDKVETLAEEIDGPSVRRLQDIAATCGVAIVTGFAERHGTELYNAAIAIAADGGIVGHHHKVFLFGAQEKQTYRAGREFPVFKLAGRSCGLAICYDIEFPEVTRDMKRRGAEIIFVPTANMEPYFEVPITLVRARALESGVAIVYANLCGVEDGQRYTGLSGVALPDGKDLARAGHDECVLICDLEPGLARNELRPFSRQLEDLSTSASHVGLAPRQ